MYLLEVTFSTNKNAQGWPLQETECWARQALGPIQQDNSDVHTVLMSLLATPSHASLLPKQQLAMRMAVSPVKWPGSKQPRSNSMEVESYSILAALYTSFL